MSANMGPNAACYDPKLAVIHPRLRASKPSKDLKVFDLDLFLFRETL